MVDTTKVKSVVADLDELGTAFSTVSNPLKTYIDSLYGGTGTNIVVTHTSPPGGETTFSASPADPSLCFVFLDGVFQTESIDYSIVGLDIVFGDTVPQGVNVVFVERKLASNTIIPGGLSGQFLGKVTNSDGAYSWLDLPVSGGGGGSGTGTSVSLSHFSIGSGPLYTITKNFDLFSNTALTRSSAGNYEIAFTGLTFPDANSYVVNITTDSSAVTSLRSPRLTSRTTTGFTFVIENQSGVAIDPASLNILVSGDPQLLTTTMIAAPVGSVTLYGANYVPVGHLVGDGQEVSKEAYAALYNVLSRSSGGYPWAETATTFFLPDLTSAYSPLLPCFKAIPDYNNYVSSQLVESFVVTASSQSIFSTTEVDTRYAYVFINGAYQPPTTYTTPTEATIQFNTPVYKESIVDIVKVYAASTPPASRAEMKAATSTSVMATPATIKDSPFGIKAWAKCTPEGVLVDGRGLSVEKLSTGKYRFTFTESLFSNNKYVTVVTPEQDSYGDTRICTYVYNKTSTRFNVNTQNAAGVDIDKRVNVIVVGS